MAFWRYGPAVTAGPAACGLPVPGRPGYAPSGLRHGPGAGRVTGPVAGGKEQAARLSTGMTSCGLRHRCLSCAGLGSQPVEPSPAGGGTPVMMSRPQAGNGPAHRVRARTTRPVGRGVARVEGRHWEALSCGIGRRGFGVLVLPSVSWAGATRQTHDDHGPSCTGPREPRGAQEARGVHARGPGADRSDRIPLSLWTDKRFDVTSVLPADYANCRTNNCPLGGSSQKIFSRSQARIAALSLARFTVCGLCAGSPRVPAIAA